MKEQNQKPENELLVFIARREGKCGECGEELLPHSWIILQGDKRGVCLSCADLDHLAFLPGGDHALTRRAKKYSRLYAVVVEWSRARKRYERHGLLVEDAALERAEQECAADADVREQRRERAAQRRAELDQEYVGQFAARVREQYPHCPAGRENVIADHACRKYSGRVGRSAAAKALDPTAVRLAVTAHVRHAETNYDELLLSGWARRQARDEVQDQVSDVLERWGAGGVV